MRDLRADAALAAVAMAALVTFTAGMAEAQVAAPNPGAPTVIPEKTAPGSAPATNLDNKSGTLSEKLSDTKGVIKPTDNVDPNMHVPAPQTGTMPVIKPGQVTPGTAK